jgi:hypothetical protein
MSTSLSFFAIPSDVSEVLGVIESIRDVEFTLAGMFDQESLVTYPSSRMIDNLGVALKGAQNHELKYLVSNRGTRIEVEHVRQRDGTLRFAVDQKLNPATVVLRPGGIYGDGCVIAGQIGTCNENPVSMDLLAFFTKTVKKHFKKVRSFWVGEGALKILDSGGRLTTNVKAPIEYDLRP